VLVSHWRFRHSHARLLFVSIDASTDRNLYPGSEGVLVRSTARKLLDACAFTRQTSTVSNSFFVGAVAYKSLEQIRQELFDNLQSAGINAFQQPMRRARMLLLKRPGFAHESGVRLMYLEQRALEKPEPRIQIRFSSPEDVFDEIRLDPRLVAPTWRSTGRCFLPKYSGRLGSWELYQRTLLTEP